MVRTVNQREHDQRRDDIVDAAGALLYAKGYEKMTIQDIRDQVGLTNGAFFHYFKSKPDVLAAWVERVSRETAAPLTVVLTDPGLSAVTKLQQFFGGLDHLRAAHADLVVELLRTWYTDENARVRQRVDEAVRAQRAPLLAEVIRQGVSEGVFAPLQAEQAADIVLTLIARLGTVQAQVLLGQGDAVDRSSLVRQILTTRAAFVDAVERVLGAPANCLSRGTPAAVETWLEALHQDQP
jgi:AcrR family transcriptional regulator